MRKSGDFIVKNEFIEAEKDKELILDPIISPTPTQIIWEPTDFLSCSDCLTPVFSSSQENIQYTLYLTNADGCVFTRTINVNLKEVLKEIIFPNIFSPNGDGRNDTWDILFTKNQQVSGLSVYDRWGNMVFNSVPTVDQTSINWDGKMADQFVLPGVYVYLVELKNTNGLTQFFSGDITIIR
ncbi:MAG: gliding motility-associated C-terminal domain-containing protein [Saprospiraceae bacterium]|nr:gliding motility-associated C-terminal domain-containing protein [Saprospiraceae bacterium]